MPRDEKTFMIEDANIVFRNFTGEATQFNAEGKRNFCVTLDEKTAKQMDADGWLIKALSNREEGEPDVPYIQVAVGYKFNPPHIVMITDTARTYITEDMVGSLDWVDIRLADLICRGYDWEVGGKSGTKAYLKTLFITVEEDALQRKYALMEQGA